MAVSRIRLRDSVGAPPARDGRRAANAHACESNVLQDAGKNGAAYRIRTYDPLITNEVLYQLS